MSQATSERVITWRRSPIDPKLLEELNERSDAKGFIQAGGYLGICVATGVTSYVAWYFEAWWWLLLALFLHGTVTAFMINGVHELVHGTVFKTQKYNDFFVHLFALIGWINHRAFWGSHTEHHKYTLHQPDDLEVTLPTKYRLRNFLRGMLFQPSGIRFQIKNNVRLAEGRFQGDWENHLFPEDAKARRQHVMNWSRTILAFHLTLAVVSVWTGQWIIPIIVSASTIYGNWLFLLCNNTQHIGLVDDVPDFRLCCRTIYLNPVTRFLYWQMNYHIEHHMFAGVPCYNLKRLHEAIRDDLPPIPNGLAEAWAQIAHIQARQKFDPDFQYRQPLPEDLSRDEGAGVTAKSDDVRRTREAADAQGMPYRRWECSICGFIYDESIGLPEEDIAPGTRWEEIPDDWRCPDCGVAKEDFEMVDIGPSSAAATVEAPVAADAAGSEGDA